MSYVYSKVDDLEGEKKVGTHQCVALVQHYTNAGPASGWRQGEAVFGNHLIRKGTAIATFNKGRYPNQKHGNHAAFFVRQAVDGIYVMDQWKDGRKTSISERFLESLGKNKDGSFKDPSNNADAFYVIEH
ncbi:BPSL0067 family protein [Pseudoduganella sp. FT25W]|uniref:BPSL0067 family protein n=1 Tax=Duganella alba TaxID=2666081 RepID=A0A6L5QFD8_9BURK|nr:BPSL0067 family protein [Duganella alba]MRX08436.1 BPSL0067 family protein [Duganella alba]MRX17090.1 BPSL0067 family protein [Duganella alba]